MRLVRLIFYATYLWKELFILFEISLKLVDLFFLFMLDCFDKRRWDYLFLHVYLKNIYNTFSLISITAFRKGFLFMMINICFLMMMMRMPSVVFCDRFYFQKCYVSFKLFNNCAKFWPAVLLILYLTNFVCNFIQDALWWFLFKFVLTIILIWYFIFNNRNVV